MSKHQECKTWGQINVPLKDHQQTSGRSAFHAGKDVSLSAEVNSTWQNMQGDRSTARSNSG